MPRIAAGSSLPAYLRDTATDRAKSCFSLRLASRTNWTLSAPSSAVPTGEEQRNKQGVAT